MPQHANASRASGADPSYDAIILGSGPNELVAACTLAKAGQRVLVTDRGQLIRCGVSEISIKGRKTRGVIVFSTAEDERVVSVERLSEEGEDNGE